MMFAISRRVVIALLVCVCFGLCAPECFADYLGKFPGKGSLQAWKKAAELNEAGITLRKKGKPAEAVTKFDQAITLYPSDESFYCNKGLALKDLGQSTQAEAAYRAAIKMQPNFVTALNNLGALCIDQRRYREAETYLRKTLELSPADLDAMWNLAETYERTGRFDESYRMYLKARDVAKSSDDVKELDSILSRLSKRRTSLSPDGRS